jgi:UDP-glucuronate decarboxylase
VREHDVRDPFPSFDTVDYVYHFASRASPKDFGDHPAEIATTNSHGTKNALEVAQKHDSVVVLASTSEVYGNPKEHPQTEAYNGNVDVRGPRAPYDEGKRYAEALSTAYISQYDLDVRTVRIFNTYGPRMRADDGRVVPNFLTQALEGRDLTVHGEGTQTRSFCYVSDLVRGVVALGALSPDRGRGAVVNLGSTEEVTILDLAETVIKVTESDISITYEPRPPDDPEVRRPDLSRATNLLDWQPEVDLDTGLKRTLKYFKNDI